MKVLFVTAMKSGEPIGIMYLASLLKEEGHEVDAIMLEHEDIFEKVSQVRPDIIAYSIVTGEQKTCLDINRRLKEEHSFYSVWGGSYPTFSPELIYEDGVDAICIGEGEFALVELVNGLESGADIRFIKNLWLKSDGHVCQNELRPLIDNLDSLPFPDRKLLRRFQDENECDVMTSRGCPYRCSYCFNHLYNALYKGKGKIMRYRSIDNVIQELEQIDREYNPAIFRIHDDSFILDKKRVKEFSTKYRAKLGKPFTCNVRVDLLDEETAYLLAQAGSKVIAYMGVESGNEEIRRRILKRSMSNRMIIDACNLLHDHGILVVTQNMVGIPGTTIENDLETLNLNLACKPYLAWVSVCTPYPKTGLYLWARENNLIEEKFEDCIHETFHYRTSLQVPHATEVDNLHKMFSLGVEYPEAIPAIRKLMATQDEKWFEEMRLVFVEFRKYKYRGFVEEGLQLPEIIRSFLLECGVSSVS